MHSRQKHTKFFHYWVLWPLYILCEVAIIATELAELIGSATAISILFPVIPLWAGVLITSADVLVVLALGDVAKGGGPSRTLELIVGCLVRFVLEIDSVIINNVLGCHGFRFAHRGCHQGLSGLGSSFLGFRPLQGDFSEPGPVHLCVFSLTFWYPLI